MGWQDSSWILGYGRAGFLAVALLIGCSQSGGQAPANDTAAGAVGRESLADELAAWICDGAALCCDGAGVEFDRDRCLQIRRDIELRRWSREEESGPREFSEIAAARCSDLMRETPPQCGNPRLLLRSCFQVLDGAVELGGACEYKSQCRGQREGLATCRGGVCAQRIAIDADCDPMGGCDQCVGQAVCLSGEDGAPRCRRRVDGVAGLGEPCGRSLTAVEGAEVFERIKCEPELLCDPVEGCVRRSLPGEPCPPPWASIRCASEGRCVDGVCRKDIELGEPCEGRGCAEGLYCSNLENRCVPYVEEGGHCARTTVSHLECEPGLACSGTAPDELSCTTLDSELLDRTWCTQLYARHS